MTARLKRDDSFGTTGSEELIVGPERFGKLYLIRTPTVRRILIEDERIKCLFVKLNVARGSAAPR